MKAYIAASFIDREFARVCKAILEQEKGIEVNARWLTDEYISPRHSDRRRAQWDLEDVKACDFLVCLSGRPSTTGGQHVEFGIALALGKPIIVVGELANIFQHLPQVKQVLQYEDIRGLKDWVKQFLAKGSQCDE